MNHFSPEYSPYLPSAEFADRTELLKLFQETRAQLSMRGVMEPINPDAELKDGIPIITEADHDDHQTGVWQLKLSSSDIIRFLPQSARRLQIKKDTKVLIEYSPEHYYSTLEAKEGNGPRHYPEMIWFLIPQNKKSIYAEDSITLEKQQSNYGEFIDVQRERLLKKNLEEKENPDEIEFGIPKDVIPVKGDESPEFRAQFDSIYNDLHALTKEDVKDLLSIVQVAVDPEP